MRTLLHDGDLTADHLFFPAEFRLIYHFHGELGAHQADCGAVSVDGREGEIKPSEIGNEVMNPTVASL